MGQLPPPPHFSFFRPFTQTLYLLSVCEVASYFRWSHSTSNFSLPNCKLISISIFVSLLYLRKWWPSFSLWPLCFNLIPGSDFSHFLWDLTPKVFYSVSSLTTFLWRSTYYKHTGIFHPQIWTIPPPHSTLSLNFCLFNQTTRKASLCWLFTLHLGNSIQYLPNLMQFACLPLPEYWNYSGQDYFNLVADFTVHFLSFFVSFFICSKVSWALCSRLLGIHQWTK